MNYIDIDLSANNSVTNYDKVAGRQGESYIKGIRFTLPPEYSNWAIFVETQNAEGYKKKRLVRDIENNIAIYKFRKKDLCAKGSLLVDLVLESGECVYKPFSGEFSVKYAICAPDKDPSEEHEEDLSGCASKIEVEALKYLVSQKQDAGDYLTTEQLDDILDDIISDDEDPSDDLPEGVGSYILTEQDKADIADIVAGLFLKAEGESF